MSNDSPEFGSALPPRFRRTERAVLPGCGVSNDSPAQRCSLDRSSMLSCWRVDDERRRQTAQNQGKAPLYFMRFLCDVRIGVVKR